tara:strand:+ start:227 stop:427 length:201 start_codon:yes stop_codon:yes gene_type:complete
MDLMWPFKDVVPAETTPPIRNVFAFGIEHPFVSAIGAEPSAEKATLLVTQAPADVTSVVDVKGEPL